MCQHDHYGTVDITLRVMNGITRSVMSSASVSVFGRKVKVLSRYTLSGL